MPACGWTIEQCACGCWESHSPATRETATILAANLMWVATGRRYGLCEITTMPCNPQPREALYQTYPVGYDVWGDGSGGAMMPVVVDGEWHNRCSSGCTCRARCEVPLDGPVASINEVRVDGDVVDNADGLTYEVHDGHLLVRKDGQCWPTCQTYGTEIPGFTVTYDRGDPIPPAVQTALEMLACEYAKACTGGECQLPPRLTRLSRQGVEVSVAEINEFGDLLRTNIPIVDAVIAGENPGRLQGRPQVFSPDLHPARVVTWSGGS
jgi:hypothetical protein